jgi:membrane protease YdiL (CAAX protease family)
MIIAEAGVLIMIVGFLKEHRVTWAEAFGFDRRKGVALLLGAIVGGLVMGGGILLQQASIVLMKWAHLAPEEQQAIQALRSTNNWFERLSMGLLAVFMAPIVEEIFFRGILYPAIKKAGFPRLALWVSAVLFAAVHMNMATFLPLLVLAIAFTGLYEATGNLLGPIMAHAVFNACGFVALLNDEKGHWFH